MRIGAALGIASLLVFAGCRLNTNYFSDYQGKNLLSNYTFNAMTTGSSPVPKWALEAYTQDFAKVGNGNYDATYSVDDYMRWESVGTRANDAALVTAGLNKGPDGSSTAYRLEIKNLFNDGDFESATNVTLSTISDSWWSVVNTATAQVSSTPSSFVSAFLGTNSPYSPISSQSLFFSGTTVANELVASLNSTSVPFWKRSGGYSFRFDFRETASSGKLHSKFSSNTSDGNGIWDLVSLTPQSPTVVAFSHDFTKLTSPATETVTLGSSTDQDEAVIDNVRVVQTDIPPYVTTSFPSLKSGSLQLLPGSRTGDYKLAFWVHDDPTADQTNGSHLPNRFEPSGVTVRVTAAVKSGSGTFVQFVPRDSSWANWKQLTFSMGFDFVNSDSLIPSGSSALRIEIAPTNTQDLSTGGSDVGSVLIAQPAFTFNP